MMYTHFFQVIASLLLIFTSSAMELYNPTSSPNSKIHTPIAHLRNLEGKERKEFIDENRGKISLFIKKIHYNNEKLLQQQDNIKGILFLCSGTLLCLGTSNSLLYFFKKPLNNVLDYFKITGTITGLLAGIGLIVYGTKKSYDNSFEVTEKKIKKNKEVLYWLRHNDKYNEKENS